MSGLEKRMRDGYEWVHSLVDDRSRYAYSELHRDEKGTTVTAFVERALAHFPSQGIEAKRLNDNAFVYRHNRSLRALLAHNGVRSPTHRVPPTADQRQSRALPANPQARVGARPHYRSSDHRAQALSHCLRYYNERRPHSSLGGRPPISRVHNLPRQDT